MTLDLALTSQQNWLQIYSESRSAVPVGSDGYVPIPAFEIGVKLSTPVIACRATSVKARGWWRSAGTLYQRYQIGTIGSGNALPEADGAAIFVPLNRTKLVQFDLWKPEYSLVYACPYWFEQVKFEVWSYIGPIGGEGNPIDGLGDLGEMGDFGEMGDGNI